MGREDTYVPGGRGRGADVGRGRQNLVYGSKKGKKKPQHSCGDNLFAYQGFRGVEDQDDLSLGPGLARINAVSDDLFCLSGSFRFV